MIFWGLLAETNFWLALCGSPICVLFEEAPCLFEEILAILLVFLALCPSSEKMKIKVVKRYESGTKKKRF